MSLVQRSSVMVNGSVALVALATAVWFDKHYKKDVEEDSVAQEKTMKMKKYVKLGSIAIALLVVVPLVMKLLGRGTASSSFSSRLGEASSNIRSSSNHSSMHDDDFSSRVSAAAKRLREQIAESSMEPMSSMDMDMSSMEPMSSAVPESASSLAAQASAEISKFIHENQ